LEPSRLTTDGESAMPASNPWGYSLVSAGYAVLQHQDQTRSVSVAVQLGAPVVYPHVRRQPNVPCPLWTGTVWRGRASCVGEPADARVMIQPDFGEARSCRAVSRTAEAVV
jgi:hypothetical protein